MISEIYFASNNTEKIRIVRQVWEDLAIVKVPSEMSISLPTELEKGLTYEQNANFKASWLYQITHSPTIADDSGMEIKGLHGKPGICTRRWAGELADDSTLVDKTIFEIHHLSESERVCDFIICATAILDVRRKISVIEKDTGVLLLSPRGIFIPGHPLASLLWIPEKGASLAELLNDSQFQAKDIRAHKQLKDKVLHIMK